MKTKPQLIIQFHAALRSAGITDAEQKREMVFNVSGGRVTSSKDLTEKELETLIQHLNGNNTAPVAEKSTEDTLRKRIISKFREMGYQSFNEDKGRLVADMKRIETKVEEHWHKKLNDFDKTELTKIVAVLEREWLPHFYKSKSKPNG